MWRDARIAILPDRVAVRAGRAAAAATVAADQPDGLARALAGALAGARCKGAAEVVLGHALAPVWLLTAPAMRLDWRETQGWAGEQLASQLGERLGHVRLACQPAPPGQPLLVSALDEPWLDGLLAILSGQGVRARSVEPWLAVAGNRRRAKLHRGDHWLALAEPERLTLAFFRDGRPQVVRSLQAGADPAAALADTLRREALLSGLPERAPVWLEAAGVEADWRASGLEVQVLAEGGAPVLIEA